MRYTICAIIKNETLYLDEWIQHHLSIGFTDIHLYEDYGSEPHSGITSNYPNVYLHSFAETNYTSGHKQMVLFEYFINNYKHQYDWCAFIDADEFIRFADGYNLEKLCNEFKDNTGVKLCWKVFNSNGHITRPQGKLQDVYTNVASYVEPNYSYKSLANFSKANLRMIDVHSICGGLYTDHTNKRANKQLFDKAWIDHYWTKSYQDWLERFTSKGDVLPNHRRLREFFFANLFTPEQIYKCKELYCQAFPIPSQNKVNKKRLLIVGNKPINNDITDIVNSYDLVLRYNKLDNSDKTGLRCDIYFPYFAPIDFMNRISPFKLKTIKNYSKYITCSDAINFDRLEYIRILGEHYVNNNTTYSRKEIIDYFGLRMTSQQLRRFQSMCKIILYAVYAFSDEYTIDVTAFDLDRLYFKGDNWLIYGQEEYTILAGLIVEGKFNYLNAETLGK